MSGKRAAPPGALVVGGVSYVRSSQECATEMALQAIRWIEFHRVEFEKVGVPTTVQRDDGRWSLRNAAGVEVAACWLDVSDPAEPCLMGETPLEVIPLAKGGQT